MAAICASGRATPPRGAGLDRLQARLDQGAPFVATLAGARIVAEAQTVSFSREAGEWRRRPIAPLRLEAGQTSIWDGRFEIAAEAPATVTPTAGSATRLCKTARARLLQTPACDRPALPLLWRGDEAEPPRPFGEGPALARPLAGDRLRAACGLISQERDIPKGGMAQSAMSSYVDDLALA
jgi:tRNA(Ile)-lysidine synthase